MAESTRTRTYADLTAAIGYFLYGTWTPDGDELIAAQNCALAAYDKFLMGVSPATGVAHVWSFKSPSTTLATVADQATNDLPDDFMGMKGQFAYGPTDYAKLIEEVDDQWIQTALSGANTPTGPPHKFAIRPKAYAEATAERYEVVWYFIPDSAYTLYYTYDVNVAMPTAGSKYLLGSGQYGAVLRQMGIAEGELMERKVKGPQAAEADRLFAAAIVLDRKRYGVKNLGPAEDGPTYQPQRHAVRDDIEPTGW